MPVHLRVIERRPSDETGRANLVATGMTLAEHARRENRDARARRLQRLYRVEDHHGTKIGRGTPWWGRPTGHPRLDRQPLRQRRWRCPVMVVKAPAHKAATAAPQAPTKAEDSHAG